MRIALGVEYDGSDFCGWQSQDGVRTVQDVVETAVGKVAAHTVKVVCAGRTDTGVHATSQVIHFETESERSERSWVLGTNANLPADVAIHWARVVPEDFHARFAARSRRYRYVICNRWVRPALLRGRVTWMHHELDAGLMQQGADHLVGEHDFSTFRALACQAKSPVRHMYRIDVHRVGEFIYIDLHANAFLHHMVRNIAGVLMTVGRGEQPPAWVGELLQLRNRTLGGVTAPPDGLYLVDVEYDANYRLPRNPGLPGFDQPWPHRAGDF
ncbi:MAG: tRNA pseudouridine(38-40) synthase TruA [Gammaproteobacteria bacterium]